MVTKSATDVMQEAIAAAVLEGLAALKAASGGLPNNLLREISAIHANTTFPDLPRELQASIVASVRTTFARLLKEGYSVAPGQAGKPPHAATPYRRDGDNRGPRREGGPGGQRRDGPAGQRREGAGPGGRRDRPGGRGPGGPRPGGGDRPGGDRPGGDRPGGGKGSPRGGRSNRGPKPGGGRPG